MTRQELLDRLRAVGMVLPPPATAAMSIVEAVNPILNEHRTEPPFESSAEAVTRVIAERDALRQQVERLRAALVLIPKCNSCHTCDQARAALKDTAPLV